MERTRQHRISPLSDAQSTEKVDLTDAQTRSQILATGLTAAGPSVLGSTIFRQRVGRGWSQETLAERVVQRAAEIGTVVRTTKATISAIETGRQRGAQPETMRAIALALDIPPDELALLAHEPPRYHLGIQQEMANLEGTCTIASRFTRSPISQNLAHLNPRAAFDTQGVFQARVNDPLRLQQMQRVAYYVASRFCVSGGATFVTDGSSTFYVCVAIAVYVDQNAHLLEQSAKLLTNNQAFSAELAARWQAPIDKLQVEFLGGPFNYNLQATFRQMDEVASFVRRIPLVVTSARYLTLREGPVGPDDESRTTKYAALQSGGDVIFVLDADKFCPKTTSYLGSTRVYPNLDEWYTLLRSKRVFIISDKPIGCPANTLAHGEQIAHGLRRGIKDEGHLDKTDLYCLEAYRFATFEGGNIEFIEIEATEAIGTGKRPHITAKHRS